MNLEVNIKDPIEIFSSWMEEAYRVEPNNHNAAALGTANSDAKPFVRMVLLKSFDRDGFVFYTNKESIKGQHLDENPVAALCIYWKSLSRQVRIEGSVKQVTDEESDKYFLTRSRNSKLGAWASKQSQKLQKREDLDSSFFELEKKYTSTEVPRPPYWVGYRILPSSIEFWEERPFRLHQRKLYSKHGERWTLENLYP